MKKLLRIALFGSLLLAVSTEQVCHASEVTVDVSIVEGTLACDPDPAPFGWEQFDQLRWNLVTSGYRFVSITYTPFNSMAVSDSEAIGTQNNEDEDDYTYTITVEPTGGGSSTSGDFTINNKPRVG